MRSDGMKYTLDTNTIILLLRENEQVNKKFDHAVKQGDTFIIPAPVNFEIVRGFKYKSAPKKEAMYNHLVTLFPIGDISHDIWERAADIYVDLRRAGRTPEDADLLIAAFSIINNCTLITTNTKHFEDIDKLVHIDWTL